MTLPIDIESYNYRFYKNLNDDVKLESNEFNEWDIVFENDDWVNISGFDSLLNACVIAILTRFGELNDIVTYEDFGCRIHELIKANKSKNIIYMMELFVTEVLSNIRRIKKVNWVNITDNPDNQLYNYKINFSITALSDDEEDVSVYDGDVIEESFKI